MGLRNGHFVISGLAFHFVLQSLHFVGEVNSSELPWISQDGRSSSLTAPNGPSQQMVIHGALVDAELAPDALSGLEMHGTGTALGDPIEVGALSAVMRSSTVRLTAAKSITGHGEPAAGLASLIECGKSLIPVATCTMRIYSLVIAMFMSLQIKGSSKAAQMKRFGDCTFLHTTQYAGDQLL
jgi:Beta-ketoacyl synthase, C-terminal domain